MDLPMPAPTNPTETSLQSYKVFSFDVYGSLIEYKSHILDAFSPLLSRLPSSSPYRDNTLLAPEVPNSATKGSIHFLRLFQKTEDTIKLETPLPRFDAILAEIWRRIARSLEVESPAEEAEKFGSREAIASWPCFPGTVAALKILATRYKLVALSNIDPFAWSITAGSGASGLGEVQWWKTFTAVDYEGEASRADESKLETLVKACEAEGIAKGEVLHVAQSLGHDHAPAMKLGIDSAWLVGDGPRWGKQEESRMVLDKKLVGYKWKAPDLQAFAGIVEQEWIGKKPS